MTALTLGRLIETLDDPNAAAALIAALDDPVLAERLSSAASAAGQSEASQVAATVRGFLETASDDHWVQLIGIMSRAGDPGLAAIRAVLHKALPEAGSA
ncbi:hypothetical protein [Enterovirga rhinocerotis]|uniref:Uncharacterized protein n=1 Tax=Enterovirga rhinocerotis TaxID=1339210 RepID=A0A4R7C0H9_9HYPH|nr:hypothetical protein [Enterovirga rhinocerotis]TDR89987.1 hypothetical protein EV668_2824 [Enterovirga rhinocerotis]